METVNRAHDIFCDGQLPNVIGSHMIDEEHSNLHARLIHMHEKELELFFVYHGQGQYMVNGRSYSVQEGDMVICNAKILHGEEPNQTRRMHSYSIALTNVQLPDLPENWLISSDTIPIVSFSLLSKQIGEMMRLTYTLFSDQRNLERVCTYIGISVLLLTFDLLQSRASRYTVGLPSTASILAKRMQRYLDEHFHEQVSLRTLSENLHISEYYLAHVFKQEVGKPPMKYVMQRRIGEAQSLLMDTLLPISEISERFGYSSPCHFNAMFKKYVGMSPTQYRDSFFHKET